MIFSPHNYDDFAPSQQSSQMVRILYNTSSGDSFVEDVLKFGGKSASGMFNLTAAQPDYYSYEVSAARSSRRQGPFSRRGRSSMSMADAPVSSVLSHPPCAPLFSLSRATRTCASSRTTRPTPSTAVRPLLSSCTASCMIELKLTRSRSRRHRLDVERRRIEEDEDRGGGGGSGSSLSFRPPLDSCASSVLTLTAHRRARRVSQQFCF